MTGSPEDSSAPGALAALGHELRTPLTAIIGFAEAMRVRSFGPLDEKYVESAHTIEQAARHMLELVAHLTDAGPRSFQTFDASETLGEVSRLIGSQADASGIRLTATLPAGPMRVEADTLALRQIMINLLANALAATPRGGNVEVSLGAEDLDLVITVTDTGPGPPLGFVEGLGLTLVRGLCAAHGGGFTLTRGSPNGALAVARLPILAAG